MGNFFKPKKEEVPGPKELATTDQLSSRKYATDYIGRSNTRAPEAYSGKLSADYMPYEEAVPGLIEGYTNRVAPKLWNEASGEVSKTLLGDYDPYKSDYYKSYRAGAEADLADAQTKARQAANVGGMLRSTGRLNTENKLIANTTRDSQAVAASLAENERVRRLQAVPLAQGMAQYEENAPIRSLQAIQSYSQAGREQSNLDRMYQEYQRQVNEEKMPLELATQFANPSMYNYYQPQYTTSISPLQAATSMISPAYGDVLRSQGGNAPGLTTADIMKLFSGGMI